MWTQRTRPCTWQKVVLVNVFGFEVHPACTTQLLEIDVLILKVSGWGAFQRGRINNNDDDNDGVSTETPQVSRIFARVCQRVILEAGKLGLDASKSIADLHIPAVQVIHTGLTLNQRTTLSLSLFLPTANVEIHHLCSLLQTID